MPRAPRVEFEGGMFHVMCRGDRGEAIYLEDADRGLFLKTLGEACLRTGWRVHAYVLMDNHYHLLLETPEANLVAGMRWFQGTYTVRHNVKHRLVGHLFQGRYKAIPVDPDEPSYAVTVADYIHLNPVRARMVESEEDLLRFSWCSYRWYGGMKPGKPQWLMTERILWEMTGHERGVRAAHGYRDHIRGRIGEEKARRESPRHGSESERDPWKQLRRGWVLGGEGFREKIAELAFKGSVGKSRESYVRRGALERHDEAMAGVQLERGCAR